jgi:hypothetical protein
MIIEIIIMYFKKFSRTIKPSGTNKYKNTKIKDRLKDFVK